MPEAPMHLDDDTMAPHDDVRFPGKVSPVKAKSQAHSMNEFADKHLWLGVLLSNAPHDP